MTIKPGWMIVGAAVFCILEGLYRHEAFYIPATAILLLFGITTLVILGE